MLSEVTLHLFMVSRGIGINLNLLEINLVNTVILDVGLFYVLGDVLGNLLNDRLRTILSGLFQRKERYLTSFYKLIRTGKVVSFSCVESWRIVYGESVMRMAAKAKILATSQLLKEFRPHIKAASPCLKKLVENFPAYATGNSRAHDSVGMVSPSFEAEALRDTLKRSIENGISDEKQFLRDYYRLYRVKFYFEEVLECPSIKLKASPINPLVRYGEQCLEGLPSPYGNLVGLGPIRKREKAYRLTELARLQAVGMPAYKVLAMHADAKRGLLKEYSTYISDKFDTAFLERKLTRNAWPYSLPSWHSSAPWRRFVRPEWSLSVASTLKAANRVYWVCGERQVTSATAPVTMRVIRPAVSNTPEPLPRACFHETLVAFFLGDGRVYEYFSGRLLSIVVSALSRCA